MEKVSKQLESIEAKLAEELNKNDERIHSIEQKLDRICTQMAIIEAKNTQNTDRIANLENFLIEPRRGTQIVEALTPGEERRKKIKASATKFISSTTVHGLSRLLKTDDLLIKRMWIVMILISVSFGLFNVSRSLNDYYKYDVITNIERITPKTVNFPAVTICTANEFQVIYYKNDTISKHEITTNNSIRNFLEYSSFKKKNLKVSNLEFFKIPKYYGDCLRFNGAINESDIFSTNDTSDELVLSFKSNLTKNFNNELVVMYKIFYKFEVYLSDNYLNSYLNQIPLNLNENTFHTITIEKPVIEKKVNSPRNPCVESIDQVYYQSNCTEICVNQRFKDDYNCSIPSYYKIKGLGECENKLVKSQLNVFIHSCELGCPKECDSIQFSTKVTGTTNSRFSTNFRFSLSDLSSLKITQIPKTNYFSLISAIGGSLGVFIGVRFLSFVEVLEFIIEVLYVI